MVFLLPILFLRPSPVEAFSCFEGGSGLVKMRTADIVEPGSVDISFIGSAEIYRIPGSDAKDVDGVAALGLTYSLGSFFEIGMVLPYQVYSDSLDEGFRNLKGTAKLRILGDREKGYGVAVSAFGALDTSSKDKNLGSGEQNFGGELNIGIFGETAAFHLSGGYEKSDTKKFTPFPVQEAEEKIISALGIEIRPVPMFIFSFEALESHGVHDADDNLLLVPGIRYSPNDYMTFTVGAAIGVPKDRSEPEYQYLAGLTFGAGRPSGGTRTVSFRLDAAEETLRDIEGRLERFEAGADVVPEMEESRTEEVSGTPSADIERMEVDVDRVGTRQEELRETIETLRIRIEALEAALPGEPGVEVLNGTGIPGLAQRIADHLTRKGFRVVRVGDVPITGEKHTIIHYREGFSGRAVELGHAIPEDQYVFMSFELDEDIDIQVMLGLDIH